MRGSNNMSNIEMEELEWRIRSMKESLEYFERQADRAVSQEDIDEMKEVVNDMRHQVKLLLDERKGLSLEIECGTEDLSSYR